MISGMYYEAHVTIDPVSGERLQDFKMIAGQYGFRVADLIKVNGEPSAKDSFCSARNRNYESMVMNTVDLVRSLRVHGFKVRRYKMEDTLCDSNSWDALRLLG
jgi:hypothetical protein